MAPPTNNQLARSLRIIARSAKSEKVRNVLLQSADRLEKPGHKRNEKQVTCVYSVWDNRTDRLVCVDLPERECLAIMGIGHAGFMAAMRRKQNRWKIEKRFIDQSSDDE